MVPRAVLMKSGLVSVNTARQVNIAHSKTTVNAARPMSYLSKKAHPTVKRLVYENTTFKNGNFNQRVNTIKDKNVNTVRPKAVVNAVRPKAVNNVVKGNNLNAFKASACWGNPQIDLQDQGVIDSGCSRHMTWNMSYLTNYEEIDGGYVAFGGNPKRGKITGKGTIKTENLVDHKVKVIRCDNGTEFKNREMNQFCEKKGILRQYCVARTPQQNEVAERRNRTLIKAARTMLSDSKLPTTFWAEAVNTVTPRKFPNTSLMAVPKDHLRRFHGMDDAKEIWAAIKTRFGGNANSKKMQKAILKQLFEAFTISSKESLEKGYDRFQKLLSQLDALGAVCQMKMQNHKFIETSSSSLTFDNVAFLSQAKASSSKHKPSHSSGSYSSYTTSSSKATPTATPDQIDDLDLEEMDINWQIAMTAIKIKKFYKKTGRRPRVDGKMHVAFDKRKVECFNCHNTGHFARECKFKGPKEGSRQEAGRGQDFKPVRTEKEALMTIDEGQINWVEQTTDEELNHALMAFTVNNEVSMCSKLCLDSYNALQAKYDELQSEFGDQEAALVAHKLAVKKLESQLKASHKQQSSLNEKLNFQANQIFEKDEKLKKYRRIGMKAVKDKDALQKIVDSWFASSKNLWKLIDCGMSSTVKIGLGYGIQSNAEVLGYEEEIRNSRFKQVEYKGVPHPLSGDYTPREQEDIDDSLYEYGKYGPQPQSPSPTVSNASSIVFSICPSNDSDGELGAVSDA
ncbi:ribonuclease H-like domain-containing protein [Tanacetum coccineum]